MKLITRVWSEEAPSREYRAIEQLAERVPGILLLTATPEQLGLESHFARLRLLDQTVSTISLSSLMNNRTIARLLMRLPCYWQANA